MTTSFLQRLSSTIIAVAAWGGVEAIHDQTECFGAACLPTPVGLASWWRAEDNANDSMDANHGVLRNGVRFGRGKVGQAFEFDGLAASVQVPASASLDIGKGTGLTIEAWISPVEVTATYPIVDWSPAGTYGVHFFVSGGSLYGNIVGTDGASRVISTGVGILAANVFQHVALTYDKSSGFARLFLNGKVVQETQFGTFTPNTAHNLNIGYRPDTVPFGPMAYRGLIDELSVYSRALSGSEIEAIYETGSSGKCSGLEITRQPESQVGYLGKSATFSVEARGVEPLTYQWRKAGVPILNATNASLVLTNLQASDAGDYTVVVMDRYSLLMSNVATLTVNPAGVSIALYAGISIEGVVGATYGIQSTTDLDNTNSWRGMANIILSAPTALWFDVQPATPPQRYYRVVPGPITIP